jgi:hypothetical protein
LLVYLNNDDIIRTLIRVTQSGEEIIGLEFEGGEERGKGKHGQQQRCEGEERDTEQFRPAAG